MPKILNEPRTRMLQEVQRLLEQGGYSAVTIRAVAAGCGVGVGTVYNYFPSKEAMLAEYLLTDWRACIAAIEEAGTEDPQAVAACICRQLRDFAQRYAVIFLDEGARGAFSGSFGTYHAILRAQLAVPLRPFCESDFAGEFVAEALLTWTMAGKDFPEIWQLAQKLLNEKHG